MNLTYIIKGGTATERHMIEHLFLMRTQNYMEPRSLEKYIRSTVLDKNFDSFHGFEMGIFMNMEVPVFSFEIMFKVPFSKATRSLIPKSP